ncbi:hypothetical protein [Tabrizicola aquatica]|uniref:hypothetical protein n=1 Tax=Tabrizicola aquatica TaxID=909926 RepID=UPI000CD031B6|nr:hypothetical protein [Tabrizicola aquatica]
MLITPSLLHVKTRTGRHRQEDAVVLQAGGAGSGFRVEGLGADLVLSRLDATVMRVGPEATEWHCVRADHAAMADAGEWADLLEALRYADQERTMASGGRRVAALISEGVRTILAEALARQDWRGARAELDRFEAVMAMHPENYAAAHLLAQAHLDIGAAMLAAASQGQLSRDLIAESSAHYAAAEDILTAFDPIEQLSPLLAGSRYLLVRGIEDGADLCRDWFEDWCDLDPEDATVHATHAVHLLPDWFGTLGAFEKEARRAANMTAGTTGRAAYAIFHIAAAEALGDFVPTLDLEFFIEALGDYQDATGCQYRANVAASLLTRMVHDYREAGPAANWQLTKARAALSNVIWNRLREIHLDCWIHGADGLAYALAEVFGPALQRGARIGRWGEGLGSRIPRQ